MKRIDIRHLDGVNEYFEEISTWMERLFDPVKAMEAARVHRGKDVVTIEIDVPGVKPENLSVTSEGGLLKVEWKKSSLLRKESSGSHTFSIDRHADVQAIRAKTEHGVLTITVPRAQAPDSKAYKIPVS